MRGNMERINRMIELYKGGATMQEIGNETGVSRQYASQVIAKHLHRTSDRMQRMIEMRSQGATLAEIAAEVGLSESYTKELMSPFMRGYAQRCIFGGLRRWMLRNAGPNELHERCGIKCTRQAFHDKLRGKTQFRMDEIKLIMQYTGETFESLFGEVENHDAMDTTASR